MAKYIELTLAAKAQGAIPAATIFINVDHVTAFGPAFRQGEAKTWITSIGDDVASLVVEPAEVVKALLEDCE